jgi:hypothetical protein
MVVCSFGQSFKKYYFCKSIKFTAKTGALKAPYNNFYGEKNNR